MDPVTMVFYGVICGVLALVSISFRNRWARLLLGAVVGVIAAAILPLLRGMVGI